MERSADLKSPKRLAQDLLEPPSKLSYSKVAAQVAEDLGFGLVVQGQTLRAGEQRWAHPGLWPVTVTLAVGHRVDLE